MIGGLFRRLLGAEEAELPPPRLTEGDARAIAERAADGLPMAASLVMQGRTMKDGRTVWQFWTPTIGSSLAIDVDDATGEPSVTEFGGR